MIFVPLFFVWSLPDRPWVIGWVSLEYLTHRFEVAQMSVLHIG
jgi:hypothetical protein